MKTIWHSLTVFILIFTIANLSLALWTLPIKLFGTWETLEPETAIWFLFMCLWFYGGAAVMLSVALNDKHCGIAKILGFGSYQLKLLVLVPFAPFLVKKLKSPFFPMM